MRVKAFENYLKGKLTDYPEQYVSVIDLENEMPALDNLKNIISCCSQDSKPPAVIAANGTTLMHVINAVKTLKIKMPSQMGVCGFDDWGWLPGQGYTSMIDNGITALITNPKTIGQNAANMILRRIKEPYCEKISVPVSAKLVIRGSTLL